MAGVSLQLYTLDSFSDVPFKGTACVVFLVPYDVNLDEDIFLKISAEMNLTETAFIQLLDESDSFHESGTFGLRWFTPKEEINLCGQGTLASTSVLFGKLGNTQHQVVFKTLSGDLFGKKEGDYTRVDFPVGVAVEEEPNQHTDLIKVCDCFVKNLYQLFTLLHSLCNKAQFAKTIIERQSLGDHPGISDILYCDSLRYLLVRLHDGWSRKEFEAWRPDLMAMKISTDRLMGLIVTTRGPPQDGYQSSSGAPYDFVSRCFFPWINAQEHPVTGSAQTVLAPYWSHKLGKHYFFARQCSARGGEVQIKLCGDRVELMGKTAFVMEGVMTF